MTEDILNKLAKHLQKPLDGEPSLIYLLVGLRKLLDRDHPGPQFGAFRLYCNWALHVDLDIPGTTMDFLKRVDRRVTHSVAGFEPHGSWELIDEFRLFDDFIFLATLRQQLHEIASKYGLPIKFCDEDEEWFTFIKIYSGVIEDGTLSTKSDKATSLKAVRLVTFTKGKLLSNDHSVPFVIHWEIELKDGRLLETDVETVSGEGRRMIAHTLRITGGDRQIATEPARRPSLI